MLRNVLFGSALALGLGLTLAAPALAQDQTGPNWTGAYGGLNLGYGGGAFRYPYSGTTDAAGTQSASGVARQDSSGVLGGVQAGYNFQPAGSRLVFGLETDFDASDIGGRTDYSNVNGAGAATQGHLASRIDDLGTVRGRVGATMLGGRVMPYVTGGFAYGGVKALEGGACAACLSASQPFDRSSIQTGWTVGGGVETLLTRHLSAKVEYLYTDLGQRQLGAPGGQINTPGYGALYNSALAESANANIVRVGLNYHF
jgi:outer membrane immunogenic protein